MLALVTERDEVTRIQKRLHWLLAKGQKFQVWLGHPGGTFELPIFWFQEHGFWVSLQPESNRYWNPFGVQKPHDGASLNITCEINFPYEGINRRIAGVLAKDQAGHVYIAHRGRIGGGRASIGKQLFLDHFHGEYVDVAGEPEPIALVSELESPRLAHLLGLFVRKVHEIKSIPGGGTVTDVAATVQEEESFAPEFEGLKEYSVADRIAAAVDHALVVNRLADELTMAGYQLTSNRHCDLLASRGGQLVAQFEVKSDLAPYSIYTAIGQLLYHTPHRPAGHRLVAVLPKALSAEARTRLTRLGIDVLGYELTTDRVGVVFDWTTPAAFLNDRR